MNYIYFVVKDDNNYDINVSDSIFNIKEEYDLCIKCKYPELYKFFLKNDNYTFDNYTFNSLDIVEFCKKDYTELMFNNSKFNKIYVLSKDPLEYYILFNNTGFFYFYKNEKETIEKLSNFLRNNNDRYVNLFSYDKISSFFEFFNKDIYIEYINKQPITDNKDINFINLSYNSYISNKTYYEKYLESCIIEFNKNKLNIKHLFQGEITIYTNNLSYFNASYYYKNINQYKNSINLITIYILTILNGDVEKYKSFKEICIDTFIRKPLIYYKGKLNITLYKHIEFLLKILNIKINTRFFAEKDYTYVDVNYKMIIKSIKEILNEDVTNYNIINNNNILSNDNNYFYNNFITWIINS